MLTHCATRRLLRLWMIAAVAAFAPWTTVSGGQLSLDEGIVQIRAGDPLRGLATLNELLRRDPNAPLLALIHAYRALAYLRMDQPERAQAAAVQALRADQNLVVGLPDFAADAVALFERARRPAPDDPEAAAAAAEAAGRYQEAFVGLVTAYRALQQPVPLNDDRRLRERIITLSQKLKTAPVIPSEARQHLTRAQNLIEADLTLGATASQTAAQAAVSELRQAVRSAPWWGEAAFQLATQLQKLQLVDEALVNLSMSKMASPKEYAAFTEAAAPRPASRADAAAAAAMADVYIYWPPQFRDLGRPKVYCGSLRIADLNAKHYIAFKAPAGAHDIKFHNTTLSLIFEGGATYYIRASAEGIPRRAALRLADSNEAIQEITREKLQLNDRKKTYLTECVAPRPSARPAKR